MKSFVKTIAYGIVVLVVWSTATGGEPKPARLNVPFIARDDLRPEVGCCGNLLVKTPNVDTLVERGSIFSEEQKP